MPRCWLALLAVLLWTGASFGAEPKTPLAADQKWQDARHDLAQGKAEQAKSALEEVIRNYPREPDPYLFLGLALLRLRDPQAAELNVRRAIAVDPDNAEAHTLLGWIYAEIRGDFDAAIKEYTEVVRLRPNVPEAYNNLGVAQKRKGELDKAAASFNRALALKPAYGAALSNRGWVYAAQDKWPQARRDFEQALKINPADDGALYGLSQVLREERDYAGAQSSLGQLISRSPNFVYWLEWGRIVLVRFYWVFLLIAIAIFFKGRFQKARTS
jgi:Tfp pilus assembly protein PilF